MLWAHCTEKDPISQPSALISSDLPLPSKTHRAMTPRVLSDVARVLHGASLVLTEMAKISGEVSSSRGATLARNMQQGYDKNHLRVSQQASLASTNAPRRYGSQEEESEGFIGNARNHVNVTIGHNVGQTYYADGSVRIASSDDPWKSVSNHHQDLTSTPSKPTQEAVPVPSSQLSRVLGFAALATQMAIGATGEALKRRFKVRDENVIGSNNLDSKNLILTDKSMDALASTLCRMRGAALKLGQMLSMADNNIVPAELSQALDRVRQQADQMPQTQLNKTMSSELGHNWKEKFSSFDKYPFAAASLGQVHRASIEKGNLEAEGHSVPTEGADVVVKVQYPGVAESIDSDIANLMRLVRWTNILPKGLYIDEVMRVARKELKAECDYENEAKMQSMYQELLTKSTHDNARMAEKFFVPKVFPNFSTNRVLVSEYVPGIPLDEVSQYDASVKNDVASQLLWLTITELFEWRFMQTDPNWGNFLYNAESGTIGLIDFGAARSFSTDFTDEYLRLVWGAAECDRDMVLDASVNLGFLTGEESEKMLDAHFAAAEAIGEPFSQDGIFNFAETDLTQRVGTILPVFGQERLRPPPEDAYALHRKLSGSFMACIKLGAKIECRTILKRHFESRWGVSRS